MKVTNKIETIFSQAVALNQSGRLRNTIYCIDSEIFILNSDNTILLRFPDTGLRFEVPVSFRANDYESKKFYTEGDKIVFETRRDGFVRKKSCGTPEAAPNDIRHIYEEFDRDIPDAPVIRLNKAVLGVLDDNLSHIEFSGGAERLKIVQRNIYDGTLIEVTKERKGVFIADQDWIPKEFGPIGIRTNDFIALFAFQNDIEFTFSNWGYVPFRSLKGKFDMEGLMSWCVYDEMGNVEILLGEVDKKYGRQEQKDGHSESEPDRQTPSRRRRKKGNRRTK